MKEPIKIERKLLVTIYDYISENGKYPQGILTSQISALLNNLPEPEYVVKPLTETHTKITLEALFTLKGNLPRYLDTESEEAIAVAKKENLINEIIGFIMPSK